MTLLFTNIICFSGLRR